MATSPGVVSWSSPERAIDRLLATSALALAGIAVASVAAAYLAVVPWVRWLSTLAALLTLALLPLLLRRLRVANDSLAGHREAVVEAQRRAGASLLVSSIAHDLNNLLVIAHGGLAGLEEAGADAERATSLAELHQSLREIGRLSRQLTDLGRPLSDRFELVALDELLESLGTLARAHRLVSACQLELDVQTGIHARLNPGLLTRALLNLVINAAEATGAGGRVRVHVATDPDGDVELEVHDDGPGIARSRRLRVLSPFVSTKKGGTGLGLFLVERCATEHGGSLTVGSSPLGGALFRLRLPRAGPGAPETLAPSVGGAALLAV